MDSRRPTARVHTYALLRTILNTAVDEELLTTSPCRIRGAGQAPSRNGIRPATLGELDQIATGMPERYRLMVALAAWCALRFGELTELRREDVDLTEAVIRVRRAVTWPGGQAHVGTPESHAGIPDVSIPPHLIPQIRLHLPMPGATTRELMDRLGHSTSAMAMRYQHVADDRPAEIARRLSLMAEQTTGFIA